MPEPTIAELNRWAAERCGWADPKPSTADGRMWGRQPNGSFRLPVPNYCGSLDAAWALWVTDKRRHIYGVAFSVSHDEVVLCQIGTKWAGFGSTPAEALVRAVYAAVNGHA